MSKEFEHSPKTIKDIGQDAFISVPSYKRKKDHDVIYVNPRLYEKIYHKKFDYDEAIKEIKRDFSVTLDSKIGNEYNGDVYIDKQGDPTDIALNGNKGSGRAFYIYENCNIKGDKTPFATSPRADYSNGKYALDCAIQECLISNVLNSYDEFDNFETLAIIDLDEEYLFPHTTGNLPCGMMVRYSPNRELYRFSHRFINKEAFTAEQIRDISKKIGEMEGNKFIYRFLHGAWSIGNLSIESNMIDLDTSFFVTGRHPQWSFTDRFITNYFGYEHNGQIMVMDTILDSELNIDKVSHEDVKKIIEDERVKTINIGFAKLMGYDQDVYKKHKSKFDALSKEFEYLSKFIYDNYDNLNCIDSNCNNTYLFDFSRFFRFYGILKKKEVFSVNSGLQILLNGSAEPLEYKYDNDEYHNKINGFFKDIIVSDEGKYFELISRAIKFIELYDKLNDYIDKKESIDKDNKLIKCYLENETKTYLTARKWIRGELIDLYHDKGKKSCHELINIIIEAYSRQESKDSYLSDLTLFKEGYLVRKINMDGTNRWLFKILDSSKHDSLLLNINGEEVVLKNYGDNEFYSEIKDSKDLEIIESIKVSNIVKSEYFDMLGRDVVVDHNKKDFTSQKRV